MINAKLLSVLVVAAAIASVAVIYTQRGQQHAAAVVVAHFPKLMDQVNQVAKVELEVGDATITLVKGESQWTVDQKGNYPASPVKVRSLILGLAELQRIEPKTSNPELHAKLGLADNDPQSESMLVRLKDQNENELLAVVIGRQKPARVDSNRSEYYVRAPTDPQVWLTEGKLPSDRTPVAWIDNRVLGPETGDIQSVEVVHADSAHLRIRRKDKADDDFVLLELSEEQEVESIYSVNNIPRTLQSLTADDVIPVDNIHLGTDPIRVQVDTFEGGRINIALFKQDDKIYARLTAPDTTNEDSSIPATEQAGVLKARWQQWVYVIPEHQYDAVTIKKADLVKSEGPTPEPRS
jgi:hypothetical protein